MFFLLFRILFRHSELDSESINVYLSIFFRSCLRRVFQTGELVLFSRVKRRFGQKLSFCPSASAPSRFCIKVPQNLCSELRSLINCNAQPMRLNSALYASNKQPLCYCFANIDYSLREEQFFHSFLVILNPKPPSFQAYFSSFRT